jgi:hypothetical protein
MKVSRHLRVIGPVAALVLVFATAPLASANTTLASGTVVAGTGPQQFQYTATLDYWSVAAVAPTSSTSDDLYLFDSGGAILQESAYGPGYTNFVAVDSNAGTRTLPQTYYPEITGSATGQHWTQAQYGATEVQIPAPTHQGTTGFSDPDIGFMLLDSNKVVSISDIYLTAGESFWAAGPATANQMYLLEADPNYSSTFVQNRAEADIRDHTQVIDNCTLYTATVTGWHALVLVSDTQPVNTNPQQGIGIGLHQYDPTQPDYCPMADFPGPTPAP